MPAFINRTTGSDEEFNQVELLLRFQLAGLISATDGLVDRIIIADYNNFDTIVSEFHPNVSTTNNHLYRAVAKVVDRDMFLSHILIIGMIKILNGETEGVQSRIDPFGIIVHEFGHICNNIPYQNLTTSNLVLRDSINHYFPIVLNEYLAESYATRNYYNENMLDSEINSCLDEINNIINEIRETNVMYENRQLSWKVTMETNLNYSWLILVSVGKVLGIENNIRHNPNNLQITHPILDPIIQELKQTLFNCEDREVPTDLSSILYNMTLRVCESFGCRIEVNESTRYVTVRLV